MGTIIIGGALALIIGLVIRKVVRDKKQGKSCCCGDCSKCGGCH